MTTITIPINNEILNFLNQEIKEGNFANKANLVRSLLLKYKEEQSFIRLKEAEYNIKNKKVYRGNLRKILKKIS